MYTQWQYSLTLIEAFTDKERDKHGSNDVHIHVQWVTIPPNIKTDIQKKRQKQRRSRDHPVNHNIAGHRYRYLETKREKEIQIKRRPYTHRITDNIPGHWDRQRKRESNADEETYHYTYNQWQDSQTLIEAFREKQRDKDGSRDVHIYV